MTREEREYAIDIIQSILDKYEEDECLVTEITIGDEDIKAFKMAIKALEQEPVLDKIRAEIIQSIQNGTLKIESGNEELFRIIDKYKGESEAEDGECK